MVIIKLDGNNEFECIVDIRKQFPNISFPEDLSNVDLSILDGNYAKASFAAVEIKDGYSFGYNEIPTFINGNWEFEVEYIKLPNQIVTSTIDTGELRAILNTSEVNNDVFRFGLIDLDIYEEVEQLVADNKKLYVEFEYAPTIKIDGPLVNRIKADLPVTDEDIQNIFSK